MTQNQNPQSRRRRRRRRCLAWGIEQVGKFESLAQTDEN